MKSPLKVVMAVTCNNYCKDESSESIESENGSSDDDLKTENPFELVWNCDLTKIASINSA